MHGWEYNSEGQAESFNRRPQRSAPAPTWVAGRLGVVGWRTPSGYLQVCVFCRQGRLPDLKGLRQPRLGLQDDLGWWAGAHLQVCVFGPPRKAPRPQRSAPAPTWVAGRLGVVGWRTPSGVRFLPAKEGSRTSKVCASPQPLSRLNADLKGLRQPKRSDLVRSCQSSTHSHPRLPRTW
jgi:hypothetical protein